MIDPNALGIHYAVDSREQIPWDLPGIPHVVGMRSGDYSLFDTEKNVPMEEVVAIERKTLPDFIACTTSSRDRFKRELERLSDECIQPWVVIETKLSEIAGGEYRSLVSPKSVFGSIESWAARYKPVWVFSGDRLRAQAIACGILSLTEGRVNAWREKTGSTSCSGSRTSSMPWSSTMLMPSREILYRLGLTAGLVTAAR